MNLAEISVPLPLYRIESDVTYHTERKPTVFERMVLRLCNPGIPFARQTWSWWGWFTWITVYRCRYQRASRQGAEGKSRELYSCKDVPNADPAWTCGSYCPHQDLSILLTWWIRCVQVVPFMRSLKRPIMEILNSLLKRMSHMFLGFYWCFA